jgi:hypothetical protein
MASMIAATQRSAAPLQQSRRAPAARCAAPPALHLHTAAPARVSHSAGRLPPRRSPLAARPATRTPPPPRAGDQEAPPPPPPPPPGGEEPAPPAAPRIAPPRPKEDPEAQRTAIITGGISVLLGVAYLALVSVMNQRGAVLLPPPPEAFGP